MKIYLLPDSEASFQTFRSIASNLHFPLQASGRILGHQIDPDLSFTGKHVAYPTYTTAFPPSARILRSFRRPAGEPVASLGKVLADRSTLYKYLNPHIVGYLTLEKSKVAEGDALVPVCGIYLVDGAKGTIAYRAQVPSSRGICDVKAVLTENWLLYTYYNDDVSGGQAKSQHIVSVELYEGMEVNDKTKRYAFGFQSLYKDDAEPMSSLESSVYYDRIANITIYEQTYVFPYAISAMTTTSTKFGMATKDLISLFSKAYVKGVRLITLLTVANSKGQIQTYPRRIFDPRRPKRKPTSEEQQEERLIQYDPLIPDDPRRAISHTYQVRSDPFYRQDN
jgi:ER membrane protein complex subunit 1